MSNIADTSMLKKYMKDAEIQAIENMLFKVEHREPEIGERCVFEDGRVYYFGYRMSKNYLKSFHTTFPIEDCTNLVAIVEHEHEYLAEPE